MISRLDIDEHRHFEAIRKEESCSVTNPKLPVCCTVSTRSVSPAPPAGLRRPHLPPQPKSRHARKRRVGLAHLHLRARV